MDIVLRESERLNDTIRSFLAYARPQRQAMRGSTSRGSSPTRRGCSRTARSCTRPHEIAVDVPKEPVWFQADEGQMRQIVWNLATNGLRAMPDGGALTLSVTAGLNEAGERRGRHRRRGRGRRHRAGGARRHLPAVPRRRSAAAPASGCRSCTASSSDYGGEMQVTSSKRRGDDGDGASSRSPLRAAARRATRTMVERIAEVTWRTRRRRRPSAAAASRACSSSTTSARCGRCCRSC